MINKVNKTDISRTLQRITANEQIFQAYICVYVCVCVCIYIYINNQNWPDDRP